MEETEQKADELANRCRVGTMGWGYADWSGNFYPAEVASRDYISHYARTFNAVEIDSTFYATPRETQVKHWAKVTPETFLFCPKVPRLITHELRLINAEADTRRFFDTMRNLGAKLGPVLFQFPPDFTCTELDSLFAFLPQVKKWAGADIRVSMEFRHRSLIGGDVSQALSAHEIALAGADYVVMPRRFEITSDFVYLRLIGRHGAYPQHRETQGDRSADLSRWAEVLKENAPQYRQALVFINNDYEGFSPHTAEKMQALLGIKANVRPSDVQGSLF